PIGVGDGRAGQRGIVAENPGDRDGARPARGQGRKEEGDRRRDRHPVHGRQEREGRGDGDLDLRTGLSLPPMRHVASIRPRPALGAVSITPNYGPRATPGVLQTNDNWRGAPKRRLTLSVPTTTPPAVTLTWNVSTCEPWFWTVPATVTAVPAMTDVGETCAPI